MIRRKRTYTWDISIPEIGEAVQSNKVPSRVFDDCDIFMSLENEYDDRFLFYIIIQKTNPTVVHADILICMTNIQKQEKSLTDWDESPCFFTDWLLPRDCSPDKEYTFVVQITWMIPKPIPRTQFNLHNHLKKFLMNSSYCDVKIVMGTEELNAHKIILACCSNVFDTMLTAPMKEAAESKIIIEDIKFDVMKTVLAFLYAGEEEALDDLQMALGCLGAAEKYEIEDLKDLCEQKLCKNISAETVITILNDADTYQSEELKKECLIFIAENKKKSFQHLSFKKCVLQNLI